MAPCPDLHCVHKKGISINILKYKLTRNPVIENRLVQRNVAEEPTGREWVKSDINDKLNKLSVHIG